jgi:hypothetical protein
METKIFKAIEIASVVLTFMQRFMLVEVSL